MSGELAAGLAVEPGRLGELWNGQEPLLHAPEGWSATEPGLDQHAIGDGAVFSTPVFRTASGGHVLPTPYLLIAFEPGTPDDHITDLLSALAEPGQEPLAVSGLDSVYRVRADHGLAPDGFAILDLAEQLGADPSVRYAESDLFVTGQGAYTPNDPAFINLWGLLNAVTPGIDLGVTAAWDVTTGDASVTGVVIDVGVDSSHPDLVMAPGYDATGAGFGGAPVKTCDNHGTPVAGVIGAIMDNGVGGVGVAPGCSLVSARAFVSDPDCSGAWTTQLSWTVDSLSYAESIGAKFTNNSNSYAAPSSIIADKYAQTRANGMVHFAATGNLGGGSVSFPANVPAVNGVGSVGITGERSTFSNYGSAIDYLAPGEAIYTLDRSGDLGYGFGSYMYVNGTSFASPAAAGVAGLLFSADPSLTADELEAAMQKGALDLGPVGWDEENGWGLPNAGDSVFLALNRCLDESECDDGDPCNGVERCVNGQCEPGAITDCNLNGIDDACDIASLSSEDCNADGIPDECQLGLLAYSLTTARHAPFDSAAPMVFESSQCPRALTDVRLTFRASGDFGDFDEGVRFTVNGVFVGFGFMTAAGCGETDTAVEIGLSASQWNDAISSGLVSVEAEAFLGVTPGECPTSGMSLTVAYTALNPADRDGDGRLDECVECLADVTTRTKNPGEPGYGEPDGIVDGEDLSYYVQKWLVGDSSADVTTNNTNPGEPGYGAPDGLVMGSDLSTYVDTWLTACG